LCAAGEHVVVVGNVPINHEDLLKSFGKPASWKSMEPHDELMEDMSCESLQGHLKSGETLLKHTVLKVNCDNQSIYK